MATVSPILMPYELKCEDPRFFAFVSGNDACDLLTKLEEECNIQFRIDKNSVIVEGPGRIDMEKIKATLIEGWKECDFKRAIEISELTNQSDFQLYFKVTPAEAALMHVNSKKLMRCPGLLNFKADSNGNVCLFGRSSSASEVYDMVAELVCSAAMEENLRNSIMEEKKRCGNSLEEKIRIGGLEPNLRVERETLFDGPYVLSLWMPKKAAASLFAAEDTYVMELQRLYKCFIEAVFEDSDIRLGVPVVVFTKTFEDALNVKEAIFTRVDQLNGAKRKFSSEIRLRCGAQAMHFSLEANAKTKNDCKAILSSEEIRLMFVVNERDAPRIIGSHGITKKRIQECSKCTILLHTESKRDGVFPVEIVGASVQKCVETRHRIESFLSQTPPSAPVKEQQSWSTSMMEDRSSPLKNTITSQISYQLPYIHLSEQLLAQQRSCSHVWNNPPLRGLQSQSECKSIGLQSKIINIPKVQLSLIKPATGFPETEDFMVNDL